MRLKPQKCEWELKMKIKECYIIETFYTEYDNWCRNMWDSEFYVKWLKKDEFFETIKTYNDWDKLQKDVGLIDDNVSKKQR